MAQILLIFKVRHFGIGSDGLRVSGICSVVFQASTVVGGREQDYDAASSPPST
jgi:hypothetical protein